MANFGHFGLKFVSAQILTDNEFISYSEIGEFQKIVGGFIDMVDALAKEVEKENEGRTIFARPLFIFVSMLSLLGDGHIIESIKIFFIPFIDCFQTTF